MSMTETMNQRMVPADKIDPANYAANTYTTGGIDMSRFRRAIWEVAVGVITGATTIDANLQSATNSNFSDAVNITGSNITQITSTNNSNTKFTVEVRADQIISQTAGDRYARLRVVTGTNAAFLSATGWGAEPVDLPIANNIGLNTAVLLERKTT